MIKVLHSTFNMLYYSAVWSGTCFYAFRNSAFCIKVLKILAELIQIKSVFNKYNVYELLTLLIQSMINLQGDTHKIKAHSDAEKNIHPQKWTNSQHKCITAAISNSHSQKEKCSTRFKTWTFQAKRQYTFESKIP